MKKYQKNLYRFGAIPAAAIIAAAAFAFAGCGAKQETAATEADTVAAENADQQASEADAANADGSADSDSAAGIVDYSDGKPWADTSIDGVLQADTEVDLKDDFYAAVNKDTILGMEYHPGSVAESNLSMSYYTVDDNKLAMVLDDDPQTHDEKLIRDYYKLLDGWEERTAETKVRYQERMQKIDGLDSMKAYCDSVYDWSQDNMLLGMYGMDTNIPSYDSSKWGAMLDTTGLMLGDSAEYQTMTETGQTKYEYNKEIYKYALDLVGEDSSKADADFDALIEFEAELAEHMMTVAESSTAEAIEKTDNYLTMQEIDELLGENVHFEEELKFNRFVPEQKIHVAEPEAVEFVGKILNDDSYLEKVKNREKIYYMISLASQYSKESMLKVQTITQKYTGVTELESYEKMLMHQVNNTLNIPMQKAYVERYATPEMKEMITSICEDVSAEYCEMLSEEEWLDEETKTAAINKLKSIKINAVYPDKWDDTSKLDLSGLSYYEANAAIKEYTREMLRSDLNQPIDQDLWLVDVTETNAYYLPSLNSIYVLLGILGDTTFTTQMSKEEMYGRIGMVIGHEISHAFDSGGSQYDGDGVLRSWWSEDIKEQFDARVQKVRSYFDSITLYGDKYMNGSMLDREATADITSIQCLLRIAAKDENFDYDTFFRSFANLWAGRMNTYATDYFYNYDVHPAEYQRVNVTLQQFDEFYETYGVKEGDGMYLAPEDRIKVW